MLAQTRHLNTYMPNKTLLTFWSHVYHNYIPFGSYSNQWNFHNTHFIGHEDELHFANNLVIHHRPRVTILQIEKSPGNQFITICVAHRVPRNKLKEGRYQAVYLNNRLIKEEVASC
jgi:hypothetical protein